MEKVIRRLIELKKTEETIFATITKTIYNSEIDPTIEQIDVDLKYNDYLYNWALDQFEQVNVEAEQEQPEIEEKIIFEDKPKKGKLFCPFCGSLEIKNKKIFKELKTKHLRKILKKNMQRQKLYECKMCSKEFFQKKNNKKQVKK